MATGFVSSVENSRTGVRSNIDGSRSVSSRVSCHSGGDSFVQLSTPVIQATEGSASVRFNSQTRIQGSNVYLHSDSQTYHKSVRM